MEKTPACGKQNSKKMKKVVDRNGERGHTNVTGDTVRGAPMFVLKIPEKEKPAKAG